MRLKNEFWKASMKRVEHENQLLSQPIALCRPGDIVLMDRVFVDAENSQADKKAEKRGIDSTLW